MSLRNQQTIDYLSRLRESQHNKEQARKVLKQELDRSLAEATKKSRLRASSEKAKQLDQFSPQKLREIVQN